MLRFQEDLEPGLRFNCWRSLAGPPPVNGHQTEADVAAWLARLQDAGALVILKHRRYVSMVWGDSAAWTVGLVFAPYTDAQSRKRYGAGPQVRGVHLLERVQQHAVREPRPHVGGTTNGFYERRVVSTSRVWAQTGDVFKLFPPEGPPVPLGEAPNGWRQDAYEELARAASRLTQEPE